jgi:O-antigen ligase
VNTPALGWAAILLALVLAASPLADGFYDFNDWGALSLGTTALLVCLVWVSRPVLTRPALVAVAGLGLLLLLSFASMLWAESKDAAWTDANRLAFYGLAFVAVIVAVRETRTARLIVLILGSAALLTSLWLVASIVLGGGEGAFLTRRLNSPIGYINGTAGLLLMGFWPWFACAGTARTRAWRAAALAAATLVASTMVLTQSRAVVPAIAVSGVVVLLSAGGRTERAINLILAALGVAATLPWTLPVYSNGGLLERNAAPAHGDLLAAAIAMVMASLLVGLAHAAISRAVERMGAERADRVQHLLGRALVVGAAVVLLVGTPLAAPFIARQWRTFTSLKVNENASVRFVDASGFRYDLWRVAVREFAAHPLAGVGAGNYDSDYYRLRNNPQYVVQPHSLELQTASELGVFGVLGLIAFVGGVVWAVCARAGTLAAGDRMVKVAATGVFVAWFVHTSVDWLYDIPGLTGMAMISAALLVVPAPRARGAVARTRRHMALLAPALVVLGLLAASVGRQYIAERYATSGSAQLVGTPAKAITTLQRARALDPYSLSTLYSLAAAYARLDDYADARTALLAAAALEPHNYVPPALLGDLAVRRGDLAVARAADARALVLNPRDPTIRADVLGVGGVSGS